MKYFELDNEEEQIVEALQSGRLVRTDDFDKHKKTILEAARRTLNKTRNINIRISEKDLQKLKAKAIREGIPYQTLASSILHKSSDK